MCSHFSAFQINTAGLLRSMWVAAHPNCITRPLRPCSGCPRDKPPLDKLNTVKQRNANYRQQEDRSKCERGLRLRGRYKDQISEPSWPQQTHQSPEVLYVYAQRVLSKPEASQVTPAH